MRDEHRSRNFATTGLKPKTDEASVKDKGAELEALLADAKQKETDLEIELAEDKSSDSAAEELIYELQDEVTERGRRIEDLEEQVLWRKSLSKKNWQNCNACIWELI